MTGEKSSPFNATPSALGYLYQFRYALLATVRRLRDDPDFEISIETLDDVVFESAGQPSAILQTKHHQAHAASLSDASPDLWKTLRIWSGLVTDVGVPGDATLFLVTTSIAAEGHAASYLRAAQRDAKKALERLRAAAQTSTNKDNVAAYSAFKALSERRQELLIKAITVIDGAPDIAKAHDDLARELRFSAPSDHVGSFLERLEGWWFGRTVRALRDAASRPILAQEVDDTISLLREQFKTDNLPIDDNIRAAVIDPAAYADHVFVKQLNLFEASGKRIFIAMREYFRAFEQRSRWMREDLLLVGELDRYEQRLVEEWEIHFTSVRDELGDKATEVEMRKAASSLYAWVETQAAFPIRAACTEPFVTRGSYHILADRRHVGWHPEFKERLRALLDEGST